MKSAIAAAAARLRPFLSKADAARLEALLGLADDDGEVNLLTALQALYGKPAKTNRKQILDALRKLRQRISSSAEQAGIAFHIESDGATRTAPAERTVTLVLAERVPNLLAKAAEAARDRAGDPPMRFSVIESSTAAAVADGPIVAPSGRPFTDDRPLVNLVVVWAKPNSGIKDRLMERLRSNKYRFTKFAVAIEATRPWRKTVSQDLDRADLRLLLLSPPLLQSSFLEKEKLADIMKRKRAVAVQLLSIPELDPSIVDPASVFRWPRAFSQLKGDTRAQDEFADALGRHIDEVLAKPEPAKALVLPRDADCGPDWKDLARRAAHDPLKVLVDSHGHPLDMQNRALTGIEPISAQSSYRESALDYILTWLRTPKASPWFALLGELGMGKTTTCKALARRISELREQNEALPLPVYLDLRAIGGAARDGLSLEQILDRILSLNWKTGPGAPVPTAQEIFALVQGPGALIVWDGLDEALVHLDTQAGQEFTRLLYSILPPPQKDAPPSPSRLLISCRTHYFRTLPEQKTHFLGEGREGIRSSQYTGFLLLPFDQAQIREYFRQSLRPTPETIVDEAAIDRIMETIRTVHNLSELAERPLTLSYIAAEIDGIEQWKKDGKRVTGITLYKHMVQSWLNRDTGKHQFLPEDKQDLMEHFAADLWRSGEKYWPIDRLERWLAVYLKSHPDLADHCREQLARDNRRQDPAELLKEDFRAATFLVRDDEAGGNKFRFAHTSLQEYFLAGYLRRGLIAGELDRWELPQPSRETLDFLGQWLLEDESESPTDCRQALRGLESLRDTHRPSATRLAFAYVLLARGKAYPAPSAAGFQLPGEDLSQWEIEGAPESPLVLSNANFRGANLRNALFRRCNLDGSDFTGALAERAEWLAGYLTRSNWTDTALEGATFRECNLDRADLSRSRQHRTWFLRSQPNAQPVDLAKPFAILHPHAGHSDAVLGCAWSADGSRVLSASDDNTLRVWDAASGQTLLTLEGHTNGVNGCAWSADGSRVVSASSDKTLRVWDAANGQPLVTLAGHTASVAGCAWSPDGSRVVSASDDKTLRVWDAANWQLMVILTGHTASVNGCAWSADGSRVGSASADRTLRVWDVARGQSLLTLEGHTESVYGCAWSPDRSRVVSASRDSTLRVWDAATGQTLLTLEGHAADVHSCSWSPDGSRVASASHDNTLRVWDAASGQSLLTLEGHAGSVNGCAWSADGRRVVSTSNDNTLRVWDAASGQSLLRMAGRTDTVLGCAWSPDGSRVVSASADKTLRVWDAASGQSLLTLSGHTDSVLVCAWSPDGSRVVSASYDNTLRVWDAGRGHLLLLLAGHSEIVTCCAWSPDGSRVISTSFDDTLRVWDAASGQTILTLEDPSGMIECCAWSPDGSRVLSGSFFDSMRIWDADTGRPLIALAGHSHSVGSCAWSPDGSRVLSASLDDTLRVWDAASGQTLLTLEGHVGSVYGCAWSADGSRVVSASSDNTLRVWDAASGQSLLTLKGHAGRVFSCAWSPDGTRILSASYDGTLRTWDAATGRELTRSCVYTHPRSESPNHTDWLTIDVPNNKLLACSRDAWRHLGWVTKATPGHPPEWFPYEYFGDTLPEPKS